MTKPENAPGKRSICSPVHRRPARSLVVNRFAVGIATVALLWLAALFAVRRHCGSWRGVLEALRGEPLTASIVDVDLLGNNRVAITLSLRALLPTGVTVYGAAPG